MPKAILIDSTNQRISEVVLSDDNVAKMAEMHKLIGGYIEIAYMWGAEDVLYVDEEGFLKPQAHFFRIAMREDQPFAGDGLVVGREIEREDETYYNADPTVTVDDLCSVVQFMDRKRFDSWVAANASNPAIAISGGDEPATVIATVRGIMGSVPRPPEDPKD